MNDLVFNSQEDLYKRILPALKSKKKILACSGFKNVNENDVWDYMRFNKWNTSYGLELCEMVSDILNTDNDLIIKYCHNKYMSSLKELEDDFELPKLKSE